MQAKVYIGTSGYMYNHWWNGVFYPKELRQNKWLEFYSEYFKTVELNVTFYRLPAKSAFQGWQRKTPKDFTFAVKGSRFITHIKRLKDPKDSVRIFFDQSKPLKDKFSVVLWQLPPKFKANIDRLANFVKCLKKFKKVRHTFEFRNESWLSEDVFKLLEEANISFCLADWPEFSVNIPTTASFIYLRRHGASGTLYGGCYSDKQLRQDARNIKDWLKEGKDVYIYFNNDAHGYAVKNALTLKEMLKG